MAKMSYFRFWWAQASLVDHHLQLSEKHKQQDCGNKHFPLLFLLFNQQIKTYVSLLLLKSFDAC